MLLPGSLKSKWGGGGVVVRQGLIFYKSSTAYRRIFKQTCLAKLLALHKRQCITSNIQVIDLGFLLALLYVL